VLWIQRINAGARLEGMSYSQFMGKVKANGIRLNRKVLADCDEPLKLSKLYLIKVK
jgi:ribosomal protein L20